MNPNLPPLHSGDPSPSFLASLGSLGFGALAYAWLKSASSPPVTPSVLSPSPLVRLFSVFSSLARPFKNLPDVDHASMSFSSPPTAFPATLRLHTPRGTLAITAKAGLAFRVEIHEDNGGGRDSLLFAEDAEVDPATGQLPLSAAMEEKIQVLLTGEQGDAP